MVLFWGGRTLRSSSCEITKLCEVLLRYVENCEFAIFWQTLVYMSKIFISDVLYVLRLIILLRCGELCWDTVKIVYLRYFDQTLHIWVNIFVLGVPLYSSSCQITNMCKVLLRRWKLWILDILTYPRICGQHFCFGRTICSSSCQITKLYEVSLRYVENCEFTLFWPILVDMIQNRGFVYSLFQFKDFC